MKSQVRAATADMAGAPLDFRTGGKASAPAGRPLDLVHLSKYTLGNRALEIELLGLFRAQAGIYIERIESAVTAIDRKNATHSLKGSAKGLGAWPLAALAEEAEWMAVDGEGRDDILARLRDAVASVNNFIDSIVDA